MHLLVALVGASLLGATTVSATAPPDVGPAADAGDVVITSPDGTPLANGGSITPFTLQIPEGSTCPGDSANDDWRVQSFMIPVDDDPGEIEYGFSGPEGTQFPLFAADTRPYAHQLLPVNAGAGQPARIPDLPAMTFTIFPAGAIAMGTYRVGIACTYFRATATYWDAQIVLTESADDIPSQFVWSVVDAPADAVDASSLDEGSNRTVWILTAVAGAVAVGVVVLWARRRRPSPNLLRGVSR